MYFLFIREKRWEKIFNPCYEYCYLRLGKQYDSDCDNKCEYANTIKEKKKIENRNDERKQQLKDIQSFLVSSTINQNKKHGILYILKKEELEHLLKLIKELSE